MKELTAADFEAATAAVPLALVDFYAPWCGPCKSMEPALQAVDGNHAAVLKVDIDQNPELALRFGVRSVPTLLIMKAGEPVDVRTGAQTKSQLESWIASHA